jgi:hypothetical protein
MLTIFRRHLTSCKHSKKGRKYRACGCPLSVEGTLEGKLIRRALDVRSWEAAQKIVREWEVGGLSKAEIPTVEDAMKRFIADRNSRGLSREHIRKAALLRDELVFHFPYVRIDKVNEGIRLQVLLQINQTAALAIPWHSDYSKRVRNTLCGYVQFIRWYWSIPSSNRPVVALQALLL